MRKSGRVLRAALGSALLVLPLACGGDGNGPMDPGNGGPDIRGDYGVIHEFTLAIGTIGSSAECPGSLTIDTLVGNQFSGEIFVEATQGEDGCEAGSAPFAGTVSDAGTVTVPITAEDIDALGEILAEFGCVIVDSDQAFTGTFTGNAITVSFSADLDCEEVEQNVTFIYRIEAVRVLQ